MTLAKRTMNENVEAKSMAALTRPLNESVSWQLPGRFAELTANTTIAVNEAQLMPGTASLMLSHASAKETKFFVRWLSHYGDDLLVLVEESNRTIDPDEGLAPQTILRVVDRNTLSLVGKEEFSSMLKFMNDDIQVSSALTPAEWNARLKGDIQNTFGC